MAKNLTKREQILISFLIGIIVFYGYGNMIFMPQYQRYMQEKELLKQNTDLLEAVKSGIKNKEELKLLAEELQLNVNELEESIPPIMYQEEIIIMLKSLFEKNSVEVGTISYSVGREDTQLEKRESSVEEILTEYKAFLDGSSEFNLEKYKKEQEAALSSQPQQSEEQDQNNDQAANKVDENQEETKTEDDKYYSLSINFSTSGDYANIKKLLIDLEESKRMISIKSLVFSGGIKDESGSKKVSASIALELPYYYDSESKRIKPWELDLQKGNQNPFIYATSTGSQPDSSTPSASSTTINELKPDFYMVLKPMSSDMATITMSQSTYRYKSLYIDNENNENMNLIIKKEDGKYMFRYESNSRSYPREEGLFEEFTPFSSSITMNVISQNRVSNEDFSGVNLNIQNDSGLELIVNVYNEDSARPRFNHKIKSGKVNIMNKNL